MRDVEIVRAGLLYTFVNFAELFRRAVAANRHGLVKRFIARYHGWIEAEKALQIYVAADVYL